MMGDHNGKIDISGILLGRSESDTDFAIKNSFQRGDYVVNDLEFSETISLNRIGRVRLIKSEKNDNEKIDDRPLKSCEACLGRSSDFVKAEMRLRTRNLCFLSR